MSSYAMRLEPSIDMERSEPVVTYTRVHPADGPANRSEPRLDGPASPRLDGPPRGSAGPRLEAHRDVTDIHVTPDVNGPSGDGPVDIDDLFDEVAPPRGKRTKSRGKRRGGGLGFTVGVLALLVGGSVLAYTFFGVTNPADTRAPAQVQPAATPPLENGPAAEVAPAAPNVRVISTDNPNSGAAITTEVGTGSAANTAALRSSTDAVAGAPAGSIMPPLPRLRPSTASFPQSANTGLQTAPLPGTDIGFSGVIPPAPEALPADPDLDRALQTVDQILDGRPAGAATAQPLPGAGGLQAGSQPQVLPPPGQQFPVQNQLPPPPAQQQYPAQPQFPAQQQAYPSAPPANAYPAPGQFQQPVQPSGQQYPQTAYPQQQYPSDPYATQPNYGGAQSGGVYGPPAPAGDYYGSQPGMVDQAPSGSFGSNWLPQRRVFTPDNAPVPPADVPGGVY